MLAASSPVSLPLRPTSQGLTSGPTAQHWPCVCRCPAGEPSDGVAALSGGAIPLARKPFPGEVFSASGPLPATAQGEESEPGSGKGELCELPIAALTL